MEDMLDPLIVPVGKHYTAVVGHRGTKNKIKEIYMKFIDCNIVQKLKDSIFGHFFTMSDNLDFQGALIHNILLQRIHSYEPDELRFMFSGDEYRFGPVEFGLITGLNFGMVERVDFMCHTSLVKKYFPNNSKITVADLHDAFFKCTEDDDVLKLGLCYFVEQVLFGSNRSDFVWLDLLHIVEDKKAFDNYPWGVECYERTVRGILRHDMSVEVVSRTLVGLPIVLQIWAYETISAIATKFATVDDDRMLFPRMLKWKSTRYVTHKQYKGLGRLVVFQMSPCSDVEREYLESFQCPRPLFGDYDHHKSSDYPASVVKRIATLKKETKMKVATLKAETEMKVATLKAELMAEMEMEITTLMTEMEMQIQDLIQSHVDQQEIDLHEVNVEANFDLREVTPMAHLDEHHDQPDDRSFHVQQEANDDLREVTPMAHIDQHHDQHDVRSFHVQQEQAAEAADLQATEAARQSGVTTNIQTRKRTQMVDNVCQPSTRNVKHVSWGLTESQSIQARKRAQEKEKEASLSVNVNVRPKRKRNKPVPRCDCSA